MGHLNFYDYFPAATQSRAWGIFATSLGRVRVGPGCPYPAGRHPADHTLDWEHGRVLTVFQLIYISEGSGTLESPRGRTSRLTAGTAFLLFPGVWHRYRPDPAVGWTEHWIELQGSQLEHLCAEKIFEPSRPIHRTTDRPEILVLLDAALGLARLKPPGFAVQIGLLALQILTHLRWTRKAARGNEESPADDLMSQAQIRLAKEPLRLSPESLARSLGIGYSYFRRRFKEQTGFSPKQYQSEIRLRRVKDELSHSRLMIKEIAAKLGYHSPYHLTLDFTKRTGISPSQWRATRGLNP